MIKIQSNVLTGNGSVDIFLEFRIVQNAWRECETNLILEAYPTIGNGGFRLQVQFFSIIVYLIEQLTKHVSKHVSKHVVNHF